MSWLSGLVVLRDRSYFAVHDSIGVGRWQKSNISKSNSYMSETIGRLVTVHYPENKSDIVESVFNHSHLPTMNERL